MLTSSLEAMPTHIILWYSTFTQIYTHWPDRNAVLASRQCLLHIIWYFRHSIWYSRLLSGNSRSCIKAISHEVDEVDCIQSFCHSLFLLVVDIPNGSDFPKPVGNTVIQYFFSMRHSRIVSSYCFNSSMPNSGNVSVEALSMSYRMEAAMFFFTQHGRA
jgi:hypothetical protein